MKCKIIKAWLLIKLRQVSTTGGLAIGVVWLCKQFGLEIPPEYMPSLENIGMALAAILLIFIRESGETDALKDAKHNIEVSNREAEMAAADPMLPDPDRDRVRSNAAVHTIAGDRTAGRQEHGGFNG